MRLQQLAEQLWPYLQKFVERSTRSAGGSSGGGTVGGAPSPHALSGAHHTGGITDAQGAQFLLTDGTRTLNGNLAVAAGKTVDGVDISAHAADPSAHHAPVTASSGITVTGQLVSLLFAASPGLEIFGSGVRVKAYNGILRDSNGVSVQLQATSGLELSGAGVAIADSVAGGGLIIASKILAVNPGDGIDILSDAVTVDVTDFIDTMAGLGEDGSNNIQVKRHTDSGLAFGVSGGLTLGTPSTLTVSTTNAVSGVAHSHAVTASSDVGTTPVAALLKSTGAGGLILASLGTTGAADIGQGLTSGNNTLRALYHTHDYPHTHLIINPGGLWSLDEQFGVDIDDNLLVRGWIVGKHAIQVDGAVMLIHFDGLQPYATNWTGSGIGHMGQVPTYVGTPVWYAGKFGSKAIGITAGGTNLVRNPTMGTALSTGWLGSATLSSVRAFVGAKSAYYSGAASTNVLRSGGYTMNVADGTKAWLSAWVFCSAVGMAYVRAFAGSTLATGATNTKANEWELITVEWTNATGATVDTRLAVDTTNTGYLWIDACALYNGDTPAIFASGEMPNGTWAGTAHNSSTTVAAGRVSYEAGIVPTSRGSIALWYCAPWGGYHSLTSAKTLFAVGSGGNFRIVKSNNNPSWFVTFGGSNLYAVRFDQNGGQDNNWHYVVLTYDIEANASIVYHDGLAIGSGGASAFTDGNLHIGHENGNSFLEGYIDDLGVFNRVLDADEIRAIYESNAPVFAETSSWNFRAGRNRIWADAEGLWGVGASGGTLLGLYAGDDLNPSAIKSWGGVNLSEGDLLIGRYGVSNGGWMLFDQNLVGGNPALSWGYADKEVIRFDSGGASLYGVLDIDANGGIYQGTGTFASPTTGLKIWSASGIGRIAGYNSGTAQWYANTDGKLYAGGGNVVLDATGIAMKLDAATPLRFVDNSNNVLAHIQQYSTAGYYGLELSSGSATKKGYIELRAKDTSGNIISSMYLDASLSGLGASIQTFNATQIIGLYANDSYVDVIPRMNIAQVNTTAAVPVLTLEQRDLSEEFIKFVTTTGASNPFSTSALGAYHGKVRVRVDGVLKWMPVYS